MSVDITADVHFTRELCAALLDLREPSAAMLAAIERALPVIEKGATLEAFPPDQRALFQQYAAGLRHMLEMHRVIREIPEVVDDVSRAIGEALTTPEHVPQH